MKKIVIILAIAMLAGMGLSSCKTVHKCPAYGEVYKYQKNPRR